jgi:D-3-phosphoglycerate dehydrogenase
MRVLTTTRSTETVPHGILPKPLSELLEQSDIVVLCCPLNGKTRGLIGKAELAMMKKDAVLVNVSRGPVVDELPLMRALESGKLRGAVLDVFNEQPLPKDHPLFAVGNVILTPHMAGITTESMLRMGQGVVNEITRLIKGEEPLNFINPEALEFYQKRFAK